MCPLIISSANIYRIKHTNYCRSTQRQLQASQIPFVFGDVPDYFQGTYATQNLTDNFIFPFTLCVWKGFPPLPFVCFFPFQVKHVRTET